MVSTRRHPTDDWRSKVNQPCATTSRRQQAGLAPAVTVDAHRDRRTTGSSEPAVRHWRRQTRRDERRRRDAPTFTSPHPTFRARIRACDQRGEGTSLAGGEPLDATTAATPGSGWPPRTQNRIYSVLALASTSSMPPTFRNACSGMLSYSPLAMASKEEMVSSISTYEPSMPVNCLATKKFWPR